MSPRTDIADTYRVLIDSDNPRHRPWVLRVPATSERDAVETARTQFDEKREFTLTVVG